MNKRAKIIVTFSVSIALASSLIATALVFVVAGLSSLLGLCEDQKMDLELKYLPKKFSFDDDENDGV